MPLDIDLPLWTIKPNWSNGILERLSWLTDVMPSTYGPIQTRSLRLSPRRAFEMTFNPLNEVRSYFDLWLHRLGSTEFMVPLFHDCGRLSAPIEVDDVVIPFDTLYREFEAGGLAVIIGDNPFVYDKVEVVSVEADSITVEADNVTHDWSRGAAIHPLRRTRVSDESLFSALTNRVGEATMQFELNQANDIADEGDWPALYGDYPVLTDKPNWRESRDFNFIRNSLVLDNDHGLRVLADDAGRAFTIEVHNRMIRGRAEHFAFRQFLYRLRGQSQPLWVPTFNRDIELSGDALTTDDMLDVKKIGYAYTGGAVSGRRHVLIDGSIMREIDGTDTPPSAAEERLTLTAAVGTALPTGTFASFMDTCTLASDDIEIKHHTDTDGVAECNLGFRAFRDERVAPDPIYLPIPESEMTDEACGNYYPPLPLKIKVNLPDPLPLYIGYGGLYFQSHIVLLLPNGQKLAKQLVAGLSKFMGWNDWDLATDNYTSGLNEGVSAGTNDGGADFSISCNLEFGPYICLATLAKANNEFTFTLDPPSNGDLRIVTDQWPADLYDVAPYPDNGGFPEFKHLTIFTTESNTTNYHEYESFNWDLRILGGPTETLISSPVQKWFRNDITDMFYASCAYGDLPAVEYDPQIDA